jgi:arsenate reductase-like glutaredoxin family protein
VAKAKKPASHPSIKLVSSLPPAVVEQAAQEWLKAHGIAASKTPSVQTDPSCHALTEILTQTIQKIHRELHSLQERVARLEKNND